MIAGRQMDLLCDFVLGFCDDAFDVPTKGVEPDIDAALQSLAADQGWALTELDCGEIAERNEGAGGRCQQDVFDCVDTVSVLLRIPERQIEPLVSLVDAGCRFLSDCRRNNFLNMGHVDSVSRNLATIDVDGQVGLAEELLDAHIAHAPDRGHDRLNLFRRISQHRQIVPEDFYGRFRPDPGQQFIHALLDRLAQEEICSWDFFNAFADGIVECRFGFGGGPLVHWAETDDGIARVRLLRIVPHLRTSDFRDHHAHFGKLHAPRAAFPFRSRSICPAQCWDSGWFGAKSPLHSGSG